MGMRTLAPPGVEPVGVGEAKSWLRIGGDDEDVLVAGLIAAARERVEAFTGRALISRPLRETLDGWSWRRMSGFGSAFALRCPPLVSVEEIRVAGRDGTVSVWEADQYRVEADGDPGRIAVARPFGFPRPGLPAGGIEIDFTAGYGSAAENIPYALREAVMRLVSYAYADGQPSERAGRGAALPQDVAALLGPWRRVRL